MGSSSTRKPTDNVLIQLKNKSDLKGKEGGQSSSYQDKVKKISCPVSFRFLLPQDKDVKVIPSGTKLDIKINGGTIIIYHHHIKVGSLNKKLILKCIQSGINYEVVSNKIKDKVYAEFRRTT